MAFDEDGQADTASAQGEICERAYDFLIDEVGFPPEDIIFDPNIFAVATGIEEHNNYAWTSSRPRGASSRPCPARRCRAACPTCLLHFRGNEPVRRAMHACSSTTPSPPGMDMGIVNAGDLPLYDDIPPELREAVEDVILNRSAVRHRAAGGAGAQIRAARAWSGRRTCAMARGERRANG